MYDLRASSEDEMIAEFLKAEIQSKRFGAAVRAALDALSLPDAVILRPDMGSGAENGARRQIMAQYRGYGVNTDMFERFPDIARWQWVSMGQEDISGIRYVNYSYWIELSGGTRSPVDAARNIHAGVTAYDVPNDGFFEAAALLEAGRAFPPLILVADFDEKHIIVLEGHVRLTAYAMRPAAMGRVRAIVGYCPAEALRAWDGSA